MRIAINYIDTYGGHAWPPAPSTLLAALVAGNAGRIPADIQAAFESCAPPTIHFVERPSCTTIHNFVPDNALHGKRKARKPHLLSLPFAQGTHIIYDFADFPADLIADAAPLVSNIAALGLAGDFVLARVTDTPVADNMKTWVPGGTAARRRVPMSGFFQSLEEFHPRRGIPQVREQFYGAPSAPNLEDRTDLALFELRRPGSRAFYAVPAENLAKISAQFRHLAVQVAPEFTAEIGGHGNPTSRVRILPLPSTGSGDNWIRRVLVQGDPAIIGALKTRMASKLLTDTTGRNTAQLTLADLGAAKSYVTASRTWVSATPALLPGLYSKDRRRDKLIQRMLTHAGLPAARIEILGIGDEDFFVPSKYSGQKVRIAVEFAEEVAGVIALGMGQFIGLGLMRPAAQKLENTTRLTSQNRDFVGPKLTQHERHQDVIPSQM